MPSHARPIDRMNKQTNERFFIEWLPSADSFIEITDSRYNEKKRHQKHAVHCKQPNKTKSHTTDVSLSCLTMSVPCSGCARLSGAVSFHWPKFMQKFLVFRVAHVFLTLKFFGNISINGIGSIRFDSIDSLFVFRLHTELFVKWK